MIDTNCPNCKQAKLIERFWRKDIICGWCGYVYVLNNTVLVLVGSDATHRNVFYMSGSVKSK